MKGRVSLPHNSNVGFKNLGMSSNRSPTKLRWKPPPPPLSPSPKILHFPIGRRARRTKRVLRHPRWSPMYSKCLPLSFRKRGFDRKDDERELLESSCDGEHTGDMERRERVGVEDAERRVMRTECSFMTMERHFALKRLKKNGVKLERTLRSTVETIYNSGFDKLGKVSYQQQLQESRLCKPNGAKFSDVADKNAQQRMDEFCRRVYHSVLSKRIEAIECPSDRTLFQENENECSGHCRALVRIMVEQVRGETEQWSQIQGIVAKVKTEIEQLQQSHDYWENRAHASSREAHFLRLIVDQWREKAVFHENEVKRLQLELQLLKEKLLSATDIQAKQHKVVKKKKKKNVADKVKGSKENQEALSGNKENTGVVHETSMENTSIRRMALKDIGNRRSLYEGGVFVALLV